MWDLCADYQGRQFHEIVDEEEGFVHGLVDALERVGRGLLWLHLAVGWWFVRLGIGLGLTVVVVQTLEMQDVVFRHILEEGLAAEKREGGRRERGNGAIEGDCVEGIHQREGEM